ncbi:Hypothetical protein CINCED_3A021853 [Cinara cedri]|uniref:Uncharacterized protein n=1 Tax=Cinara cedri TaxID=506608 RepID=A0A5E4NR12_9HEMI|nr:Hypothetical protein CINCED_3A021853 [Cinara cedri]
MKLSALKMMFYTFIVHVIIPDIQSDVLTSLGINSDRSKFKKFVEDFKTKYDLVEGAEIIDQSQDDKFGKVSQEFITFEIDLLLILQQMAYVFDKRNETRLIHADYFITICTYLPRCLDFININVFQNTITVLLNKIHIVLCYSLPTYLGTHINALPDHIESERFIETIENNLSYIVSMTKDKTKKDKNLFDQQNYKMDSQNFISNVYKIIGNIDFISCISKNIGIIKQHYMEHNSNTKKIKFKVIKVSTRDNDKQINSEISMHFRKLNIKYTNNLRNECGLSYVDIRSKDLSELDTIQEIVFYTLKKLQQYCTNTILNSTKTLSKATEKDLKNTNDMMDMLQEICHKMSLILVYLKENEVNDDTIMFSTYLSFCGDFKGYTDVRCTSAFRGTAAVKNLEAEKIICIRETVKNIWMWNILITTTEVPKKKEDKHSKNENCKNLYLNYLVNINNTIRKFYNEFGRWANFVWLSGKYFLAENIENPIMYDLKSKYITIKNVNMSLSVGYYAILPWGLNTYTIGTFHNVIVNHVDRTMNTFVYIYAIIIHLYLERTSISIDSRVLQRIRNSVRWYTDGTELFYKYLYLPLYTDKDAQNKPQPSDEIKTIINRIKNIDDSGNISFDDIIPQNEKDDILVWSEPYLQNNDDGYKQFNTLINENCMDAMDYMCSFFWIAEKSMNIYFEFHSAATMYSEFCPKNIFDVKSDQNPIRVV